MCCRRYGHDHRPAMITKAVIVAHRLGTLLGIQGDSGAGPVLAPWQADPRSFAVDHPSFFSACICSSDGAESMIEASVSANGASPVDAQFEPIQKPSAAVSFSPQLSPSLPVVAVKISNARSPRSSSRIRSRNHYGQPIRSASRRRRHPRKRPQQLPEPRLERIHQRPRCSPDVPRRPKLATTAFTVFREHPTTRGCRRHM